MVFPPYIDTFLTSAIRVSRHVCGISFFGSLGLRNYGRTSVFKIHPIRIEYLAYLETSAKNAVRSFMNKQLSCIPKGAIGRNATIKYL